MPEMKCPKCGDKKIIHGNAGCTWHSCMDCGLMWTDWQQAEIERLRALICCEVIKPPAAPEDDQTTELAVENATLSAELERKSLIIANRDLNRESIGMARAYLKEHLGNVCDQVFFDDCVHNAVALCLQARKERDELEAKLTENDREIERLRKCASECSFFCLSHNHARRVDESMCSAKYQIRQAHAAIAKLTAERDALRAEMNELRECGDGLREYVAWNGGVHDPGCPDDDTCDCEGKPINAAVNKLCSHLQTPPKEEAC